MIVLYTTFSSSLYSDLNCEPNHWGKTLSKHLDAVLKIMVNSIPMGRVEYSLNELRNIVRPVRYTFLNKIILWAFLSTMIVKK